MELQYREVVKRVHFLPMDCQHLAELRAYLQARSVERVSDNAVIRKALVLALAHIASLGETPPK
jgi:hypothetical protein